MSPWFELFAKQKVQTAVMQTIDPMSVRSSIATIISDYCCGTPIFPSFMCPGQQLTHFFACHTECRPLRIIGKEEVGDYIYGDTDSCFIQWMLMNPTVTDARLIMEAGVAKTHRLCKLINQMFPSPTALEYEALKSPMLLTDKKKFHCSMVYPLANLDAVPEPVIKGATFVKRDRCLLVRITCLEIIIMVMKKVLVPNILEYVSRQLALFQNIQDTFTAKNAETLLEPFCISIEYTGCYKKGNSAGANLAKMILDETGRPPEVGRRMRYVVAYFTDNRKHDDSVVTPSYFVTHRLQLDLKWYIKTNFLQSVKQITSMDLYKAIETCANRHLAKMYARDAKGPNLLEIFQSIKKRKEME